MRARASISSTLLDSHAAAAATSDETPKLTLEEDPLRAPAKNSPTQRVKAPSPRPWMFLESSIQKSQTRVSCTLVRFFGQLGDERAVPRLCTILERRPVLRRALWHAIDPCKSLRGA
jgi:hypothetical protein